jgi:tocopherol cyclase
VQIESTLPSSFIQSVIKMGKINDNFRRGFPQVMRPLAYHGQGKSGPFFEGWYFKLVSPDGASRISVIPGIYIGKEPQDSHSFVQVINGIDGVSHYLPFPAEKFTFIPGEMDVHIGNNHFTQNEVELDLHSEEFNLTGKLLFSGLNPWPVTTLSPGVMGWFAWVPGMECYHGIVSMDHRISGSLVINDRPVEFSGGRGYMEKDWGRAMPRAWIWMQSNHFEREGISLSVSIADIPWVGRSFSGFLGGFLLDGELHRFATYTGARVSQPSLTDRAVQFTLADRSKRLTITAHRAQGFNLQAPTTSQMDRRIMESLSAAIDVVFERKDNGKWKQVFTGTGKYAGLEIVGDANSLL